MSAHTWDDALLARLAGSDEIRSQDALFQAYREQHTVTRKEFREHIAALSLDLRRSDNTGADSVVINDNTATVTVENATDLGDADELMRKVGLDPAEWLVQSVTLKEWDAMTGQSRENEVVRMTGLVVRLLRRISLELVAPAVDVKPRKPAKRTVQRDGRLIVFLPDQHCPYHDPALHDAVCRFLSVVQPHEVGCLGDGLDNPTISRFRDNPAWNAAVQEGIQSYFQVLRDYTEATPSAFWKLLGNHDWRLDTELLARAERMYDIRPAQWGDEPEDRALSLNRLLHLKQLGVELVEPELEGDDYNHAVRWVTPRLAAIHGKKVKNGAVGHAQDMGVSVVMGHTHDQSHRVVTRWEANRRYHLDAAECGTLRAIAPSVGYASYPKSVQGFGTAEVFGDESHALDLARWDGEFLSWRGQRF